MRTVLRRPDQDFISFMLSEGGIDLRAQPLADPRYWYVVSIRDANGRMMAGLAVEYLHNFDAFFTAVIIDPEALTRRILRAIFADLFSRVVRLTATVAVENHASQEALLRLGFIYEGFLRRGLDGTNDALIYGMLQEDCRYLPGYTGGTVRAKPDDGRNGHPLH